MTRTKNIPEDAYQALYELQRSDSSFESVYGRLGIYQEKQDALDQVREKLQTYEEILTGDGLVGEAECRCLEQLKLRLYGYIEPDMQDPYSHCYDENGDVDINKFLEQSYCPTPEEIAEQVSEEYLALEREMLEVRWGSGVAAYGQLKQALSQPATETSFEDAYGAYTQCQTLDARFLELKAQLEVQEQLEDARREVELGYRVIASEPIALSEAEASIDDD